ncbi:MAG: energy transducer TonB [Cellulophaga sp.]
MKNNKMKVVASHSNGNNKDASKCTVKKGCKHDANLQKNGFRNFQIGLVLAMAMVYYGLEAFFDVIKEPISDEVNIEDTAFIFHQVPFDYVIEKPEKVKKTVPKTVVNPTNFEVVEDDMSMTDMEEFIDVPNDDSSADLGVMDLNYIDPNVGDEEVPFILVEDAPIYLGCEKVEKDERKACFQKKLTRHIRRVFKYPEAEEQMRIQGKVHVMFKIDTDGSIVQIELKGPSVGLENEAERIIEKLPKMIPGKQRGTAVRVPFYIPINFQLEN